MAIQTNQATDPLIDFPALQQTEERRGAKRYPTALDAHVVVGADSYAVNVRDYSADGMFLAFAKNSPAPERLAQWVGITACVDAAPSTIAPSHNGGEPLEPLQVRVVHAGAQGLGVHVDTLPHEWLAQLKQPASKPAVDTKTASREYDHLISRCISVYGTFSRKLAREVLARTADRLGALEGSDPFAAARFHYAETRNALAASGDQIVEKFVGEGFKRVKAAPDIEDHRDASLPALGELRLMQADELEDYLAASAVIKAVDEKVSIALDSFEVRYIRLVGTTIASKKNPFGPEKTLRSFRQTLSNVEMSLQSSRVMYAELMTVALVRVPELLRDLNQVLAMVEPGMRVKRPATATATARDIWQSTTTQLPEAAIPDEATQQLLTALRSKRWAGDKNLPRRVLEVIEALSTTAHEQTSAERGFVPALLPIDDGTQGAQEASLPELLAAIDRLPMSTGGAFEQASAQEVVALMQPDGEQEQQSQRRLRASHQGVLDTTARLFKRASLDFVPQSDVELLIKRLERTLLKLSLKDGEFPSSPNHPARKVVNLIEQYNFAADDAGHFSDAKLHRNLDGLVNRMCEQADQDAGVFDVVQHSLEQDLEGLRRERRQRVDRIVEALESRDRVRVARREVDTVLSGRLSERRMPRVLIALLDEVWRQHFVLIGLRHGVASDEWKQCELLIERTLAVSAAGVDDPTTLPLRQELFREMSSVLSVVVSDQPLRSRLLTELEALMVKSDPALIADVVDAPRLGDDVAPTEKTTGEKSAAPVALHQSRLGDWWDMRMEKRWVPVQLVWTSTSTGYCGFVNRSATNRMELTQAEFQRQMSAGSTRTRVSLDVPLLDRSEEVLLGDAYSETVQRSDHDAATTLLNRKGFQKRLNELDARTDGGHHHMVGLLECDQFRAISTTCGIEAVESLAKILSERLQKRLPRDCVAAMFREDTFAVVMPDYSRPAGLRTMSQALASIADYHFTFEQHSYSIGVSAGVATFGTGQCGASEVLRRVDAACLAAKAVGRNRLQEYEPSSTELRHEEALLEWAGRVDAVLGGNDLYLRAQMVMPIGPDVAELPYYEILLGIEPQTGLVNGPYEFILALEGMGRSHEIDLWVLRQSFQWVADNWMVMESIAGLSINLSAPSLRNAEVIRFLRAELSRSGFPAHKIAFEITESAAIRDFDTAEQFIREMHRYGCRFALDDFGSGFTSYAHLKRLSTHTLKIDGSYVKDLLTNSSDLAIVKSMTDIAHTLGMKVVAEWVETPQILEKLIELGVDYAQGYAVHKPVRLAELIASSAVAAAANGLSR